MIAPPLRNLRDLASIATRGGAATSSSDRGLSARMDGHALLGHLAVCSGLIGDGGPRRYRRRAQPLPEKYLPGRFLTGLAADVRASVITNNETQEPRRRRRL